MKSYYKIFIIATLLTGAMLNTGCSDDFLQNHPSQPHRLVTSGKRQTMPTRG